MEYYVIPYLIGLTRPFTIFFFQRLIKSIKPSDCCDLIKNELYLLHKRGVY